MAGIYSYRIEPRDVDSTLRVRIYTMGDLLLQAANDDADMLGFGVRDLNAGVGSSGVEASWVLSRMALEMKRLPRRHEQIDVYTWVSDYGKLFTTRNMVITDEEGLETGAAVTLWAMIDLSTRRPLDLSALSNRGTSLVDREPPIDRPCKVGNFDCSTEQPYTVAYSDIDFNGHVNSMKYLQWMTDTLMAGSGEEIIGSDRPLRIDINYIHEAKSGDELSICMGGEADRNDSRYFDIRGPEGNSICRASVRLK